MKENNSMNAYMNSYQDCLNSFILYYRTREFIKKRNFQDYNLNDVTIINIGLQTNIINRNQINGSFYMRFLRKYAHFIVSCFIHKICLLNLQKQYNKYLELSKSNTIYERVEEITNQETNFQEENQQLMWSQMQQFKNQCKVIYIDFLLDMLQDKNY
ncbi:unnamed protein product [Paramecium pentaurelia]|uniref:Uncharacterized protein n=1 Tax=Paramecium pentaurelia TaxID=43138 RepID=A0A8S1WHK9_9CILI|nr:unnamed protein product [Paramecium pentaurelia]